VKTLAKRSKPNTRLETLELQRPLSFIANQLHLTASVSEIEALRYTPSGIPALNSRLEHVSEITEAGQVRQVKAMMKSVAFGAVAEQLARQDVGSSWNFKGFVATPRGAKSVVFHIQEFAKE
jgi:primosomal replication protein N